MNFPNSLPMSLDQKHNNEETMKLIPQQIKHRRIKLEKNQSHKKLWLKEWGLKSK
jgi:hypothetical protein